MLETIGIISAICMTISSFPQAWSVYKKGSAEELSTLSLILWLIGEICYIIYVLPLNNPILMLNCLPPLFCIFTMLYYKFFPRVPPQ